MALPSLNADQIAALAGLPPESWWSRIEVGWTALSVAGAALVAGLGVLIGRRLFRRRPTGPAPSPAA